MTATTGRCDTCGRNSDRLGQTCGIDEHPAVIRACEGTIVSHSQWYGNTDEAIESDHDTARAWPVLCKIKQPISNVTESLVEQLVARDAIGRKKYGVTLDRTDLTHSQWLQHMTEELLDAAGYAQAAKREHDQFEIEVLQIVKRARSSISSGATTVEAAAAFKMGVESICAAIRAELAGIHRV